MSAMLDSLLDSERLADCLSHETEHAAPVCPAPCYGYTHRQGRGCECSDLATKEAMGPGWWLVIGASVFVILVQVTPLVRGYLPF